MIVTDLGLDEPGRYGYANSLANVRVKLDRAPDWNLWEFYTGEDGKGVWAVQVDTTGLVYSFCHGYVADQHKRYKSGMGALSAMNWTSPSGERGSGPLPLPSEDRYDRFDYKFEGIVNAWSSNESAIRWALDLELARGAYYVPQHSTGMSVAFEVDALAKHLFLVMPEFRLALVQYDYGTYWNVVRMVNGEPKEHDTMMYDEPCGDRQNRDEWERGCPILEHYVPIGQRRTNESARLLRVHE